MIDFSKRIDGLITIYLFDNDPALPVYILVDKDYNKTLHYKAQSDMYKYINNTQLDNFITRTFPDMDVNKRINMQGAIWTWGGVNINPTSGNWKGFT